MKWCYYWPKCWISLKQSLSYHCVSTISWKQPYAVSNKICCMFQIKTFNCHEKASCRHLSSQTNKAALRWPTELCWLVVNLFFNLSNRSSTNYCDQLPLKSRFQHVILIAFTHMNKIIFSAVTGDIKKREKNAITRQIHMGEISSYPQSFSTRKEDIYFEWNLTGDQQTPTYTYPLLPLLCMKMPQCHETHNSTASGP